MIPKIAIVGRPNVGKSTLFNWLVEKRIAIEDPTAGVTRDRLVQRLSLEGRTVDLVDTGGMGFDDPDGLTARIDAQIEAGLGEAAVVLFVVDVRSGLVAADHEVAARVRRIGVPVLLVANKADDAKLDVGKSTFVNSLAQEERVITSPVAGTTRDSVDVRFEVDGHSFLAIDTPGLRRTKSRTTDIDFYSTHRAQRSIRRADVVLLFFDASEPVGRVDKQLADTIMEEAKPVVFVVNKWDLYAGDVERGEWADYLRDTFRTMPWAPVAFVTATSGRNVKAVVDTAQRLYRQSHERVPTAKLNTIMREAIDANHPPADPRGRPVRIYYATQVETAPPTIVLSTSAPKSVSEGYKRYLVGALRKTTPFREVPIRLYVRGRTTDAKDES